MVVVVVVVVVVVGGCLITEGVMIFEIKCHRFEECFLSQFLC